MSTKFKSIRENYSMLLATFKDAGIKLTETQKRDIDNFILALENKVEDTKYKTILATKKVVEKKIESEYKAVVESIIKNLAKNAELAGKIQDKVTSINESKKLSTQLDAYLNKYIGEILPEQQIVDYTKMHSMQKTIKSLKTQLSESQQKQRALQVQVDKIQTDKFVESKTSDLPLFEARQVKKRLAGLTLAEVKKNFEKILESVKADMKKSRISETICLEKEIADIITADDVKEESSEKNTDFDKTATDIEKSMETKPTDDDVEVSYEDDEIDTDTEVHTEKHVDDDVYTSDARRVLTDSEKINSNMMRYWISTACAINKNL